MKLHIIKTALLSALTITSICAATSPQSRVISRFLMDEDAGIRHVAYRNMVEDQEERITGLIAIVKDKPTIVEEDSTWELSVNLLGFYRSPEAISVLVENLSVLPRRRENKGVWLHLGITQVQESYPCARALVQIGEPSDVTNRLLEVIQWTKRKDERELALWVLMKIKGSSASLDLLRSRAKHAMYDQNVALRFKAAITYVQGYKPVYGTAYTEKDGSVKYVLDRIILREKQSVGQSR